MHRNKLSSVSLLRDFCFATKRHRRTPFKMALKGIKVLELSGLAPGPFCGKHENLKFDLTKKKIFDLYSFGQV